MFNLLKCFARPLAPSLYNSRNVSMSAWRKGSNYPLVHTFKLSNMNILKYPGVVNLPSNAPLPYLYNAFNICDKMPEKVGTFGIPPVYVPPSIPLVWKIEDPVIIEGEKKAARLIVIRRRKMKKHKLRKLRKRMKFEWAKVRQKRELRKEKAFQAELIMQMKEAEKFDAVDYVTNKIKKLNAFQITKS